jgi:exopolyphosphatase/guanosine-5'-triphosphate,3'-diphosphate pyrophosphatase
VSGPSPAYRVAAIDCGTNSLRLLVCDVDGAVGTAGAALTDVVRRMEIVRLGAGVDRTGRLAHDAIERARVVLSEYARQIAALRAERVRMVATSATRDAVNAEEFRAMVRATLGAEPEVISGDEEARLSFAGAVRGLPATAARPYLVVDIGGGSTEFVLGDADVADAVSVDVGCVRMTERYLGGDPPTADQIAAAETRIASIVDGALAAVHGRRAATLVGLAGSVTTVAAIALRLERYDPARIHHARIGYPDVARVTGDLLNASRAQRSALPVMHPGRADVIGAGALILRVIMERAGFDSVIASEHDILDGIAQSVTG